MLPQPLQLLVPQLVVTDLFLGHLLLELHLGVALYLWILIAVGLVAFDVPQDVGSDHAQLVQTLLLLPPAVLVLRQLSLAQPDQVEGLSDRSRFLWVIKPEMLGYLLVDSLFLVGSLRLVVFACRVGAPGVEGDDV